VRCPIALRSDPKRWKDHRLVCRRPRLVDRSQAAKAFRPERDAGPVCHELRSLCPHNGAVINIEAAVLAPAVEGFPPTQQFPELAEAQALLAALSP